MVELSLEHNSNLTTTTFQIVDIDEENAQSGNTAEALQFISRLHPLTPPTPLPPPPLPVVAEGDQVPEGPHEFPDLTQAIGTLPTHSNLNLTPKLYRCGLCYPPPPGSTIKERAINKCHEMEAKGYIVKVTKPTEWVSSMVVSTQGHKVDINDKVCICNGQSDLNEAIKREHYPMRTIEEVISTIPDAKVFSKLDAKSRFLQIKLDEASSLITSFNTQSAGTSG